MKYKNPDGTLGEPHTFTDLAENNRLMEELIKSIDRFGFFIVFIGILFFGLIIWLIYYVIAHNVVNNIVARCL